MVVPPQNFGSRTAYGKSLFLPECFVGGGARERVITGIFSSYTSRLIRPRLTLDNATCLSMRYNMFTCDYIVVFWNCTILQRNLILAQYRSFRIRASRNSRNSEEFAKLGIAQLPFAQYIYIGANLRYP